MEIKILDAMKSFHMLRLHRIKGERASDMRIPAEREHVEEWRRKKEFESSKPNMIFAYARLAINC